MITKDDIFAQGSESRDTLNSSVFRQGLVPNTIARAEEVNMSGFMSDRDLYVVCQEINNLLNLYGVSPNDSYSAGQQKQLRNLFNSTVSNGLFLTGVMNVGGVITMESGSLVIPAGIKIMFNTDTYYGTTKSTQVTITTTATTVTPNASWGDGVHFIYANLPSPTSTTITIEHQQTPISASEGASKCMLGSVFVISGAFQAGSWKYQPWLSVTSMDSRQSPTAYTKGGFVSPASTSTLQMGSLEIKDEGINFDADRLLPNIVTIQAQSPYTYKFLYPDYDPATADVSALDTTHVYNITAGTWDDVSSLSTAESPKYIVMVPCVVPTGQTLMIPAMSTVTGTTYDQLFDSQEAAINAIYSLPCSLDNVAKRAIYLGQSLIVRVGATDLTDPLQFTTVGMVPQALAGFSSASGQAGGSVTTYRPMPSYTWDGYTTITCQNNALNRIIGGASNITVTMPSPQSSILNQLEIHFIKNGAGNIAFSNTINWYSGITPTYTQGKTYCIILEYMNGAWYGGVLSA